MLHNVVRRACFDLLPFDFWHGGKAPSLREETAYGGFRKLVKHLNSPKQYVVFYEGKYNTQL